MPDDADAVVLGVIGERLAGIQKVCAERSIEICQQQEAIIRNQAAIVENQKTLIGLNGRVSHIESIGRWVLGGSLMAIVLAVVALLAGLKKLVGGG